MSVSLFDTVGFSFPSYRFTYFKKWFCNDNSILNVYVLGMQLKLLLLWKNKRLSLVNETGYTCSDITWWECKSWYAFKNGGKNRASRGGRRGAQAKVVVLLTHTNSGGPKQTIANRWPTFGVRLRVGSEMGPMYQGYQTDRCSVT